MVRKIVISIILILLFRCSLFGEPLPHRGWQLHNLDPVSISYALRIAPEYGINEIQLSHTIIMNIDDILTNPFQRMIVQNTVKKAHKRGLKVYIWAHEFSNVKKAACLDPETKEGNIFWGKRRSAYQKAFEYIPEIDGVVLMFGSAPTEPWELICICKWCREHNVVDRLNLIIKTVHDVVVKEHKKELYVRTFIHSAQELKWIGESVRSFDDLIIMSKDVPQDFEVYYPHNPLIGNVGRNDQIIEFDLAGEYWGQSKIPFSLPDYLVYRMNYAISKGIDGAVGRIECINNSAIGTLNDVNLFALSKLLENPNITADEIWELWIKKRYKLAPKSVAGQAVISSLRRTYDIGRKMFYVLGFWALEKGSEIPETNRRGTFYSKNIAQWAPQYEPLSKELEHPSQQTLLNIFQEKQEAQLMAETSLQELKQVKKVLNKDDYNELYHGLLHLKRCTEVWTYVTDIIFRTIFIKENKGSEDDWRIVAGDLQRLESLAKKIERELGKDIWPGNPTTIRRFINNVRLEIPAEVNPAYLNVNIISPLKFSDITTTSAVVKWTTIYKSTSDVEYTESLPLFNNASVEDKTMKREHVVKIKGLSPGVRYYVRARSCDEKGNLTISGDFILQTLTMALSLSRNIDKSDKLTLFPFLNPAYLYCEHMTISPLGRHLI